MTEACCSAIDELKSKYRDDNPVRWTPRANLHLTLNFLGEINKAKLDELLTTISNKIKNIKKFKAQTNPLNTFPPNHPHTLIVPIKQTDKIFDLHENLEEMLIDLNLPTKKHSFFPHITLMRYKHDLQLDFTNISTKIPTEISINRIAVFESTAKQEGSEYKIIQDFYLK